MAQENRLAIKTFDNLVQPDDPGKLGEIITNLLIADMSESPGIQVVSSHAMTAAVRSLVSQGVDPQSEGLTELLSSKVKAQWLLTGQIIQIAPLPTMTIQLNDMISGSVVFSRKVVPSAGEDLFSVIDRLSADIRASLPYSATFADEFDPPVSKITTSSTRAYLHYLEGLRYANLLYLDEAEQSFSRAIELDTSFAMAYYQLSRIDDSGYLESAMEYVDRAGRRERSHIMAAYSLAKGDTAEAREVLEKSLESFPDDTDAWLMLADIEQAAGNLEQANSCLERIIEIDPLHTYAHTMMAYLYFELGEGDHALAIIDSVLKPTPTESRSYYSVGRILVRNGYLDQAITAYEAALAIRKDFLDYRTMQDLAYLYIFRGDYSGAHDCLQEILINGGRERRSRARTDMALLSVRQGRFSEALVILQDGIAADQMELATAGPHGDRSWKHFVRARIYMEIHAYDLAYKEYELAIKVHHMYYPLEKPLYRCSYSHALAEGGELERANEIKEILRREFEEDNQRGGFAYWYAIGTIELNTGHPQSAVTSLKKSVSFLNDEMALHALAQAQIAAGQFEDAIVTFESLQNRYARYLLLWGTWTVKIDYYLGIACEQLGRTEESIEHYRRFLDIWSDPDIEIPAVIDAQERLTRLEQLS